MTHQILIICCVCWLYSVYWPLVRKARSLWSSKTEASPAGLGDAGSFFIPSLQYYLNCLRHHEAPIALGATVGAFFKLHHGCKCHWLWDANRDSKLQKIICRSHVRPPSSLHPSKKYQNRVYDGNLVIWARAASSVQSGAMFFHFLTNFRTVPLSPAFPWIYRDFIDK